MTETATETTRIHDQYEVASLLRRLESWRDVAEQNMKQRTDMLKREVEVFVERGYPSGSGKLLVQTTAIEINAYAREHEAWARAVAEIRYMLDDLHEQGLTIAPDPNA